MKEDSTKVIVDFWRQQEEEFKLGTERDIVLLLGNTGCGKSTLTSLLTGVELESVETFPGSKQFVLVDENDRISKPNETITSKTLVPELISDVKNGISYYDCPGFEDTRSVKHDISITYSIKKLLDFSNSVKLVFLVSYTSVKVAGSRNDFINLADHATTLVKNIEKFRDGITLVVTKVENRFVRNGGTSLVNDDIEIVGIAHFLTQSKLELQTIRRNASSAEQHSIDEKIKFINILLTTSASGYDRISIIRLTMGAGPVKDMPLIQSEKERTSEIIHRNLRFVRKDEDDFGLTIADKSKARVLELLDEMKNHLNGIAANIDQEIEQFYVQQEQQSTDIKSMYTKIYTIYQTFQVSKSKEARLFLQQTTDMMTDLGINDTSDYLNKFSSEIKLIDFLKEVSGRNVVIEITNGLQKTANYLDESRKWYNFLLNLHPIVSGYNLREEAKKLRSKSKNHSFIGDVEEITFNNNDLKHFVSQAGSGIYDDVENLPANSFKLNALKRMLQQTLDENIISSCVSDKLVVKGINVKISQVIKATCWSSVKYIDIFALNRVFVDADIDKTGRQVQLSIIAPAWEIVGDRQIILDGKNGEPHANAKAPNAASNREKGTNGAPGLPGGPAGRFLGTGKDFFNAPHLKISANGGTGGAGQIGGDGSNGEKGETPDHLRGNSANQREQLRVRTGGSPGGDGGAAGLGGNAGKIVVVGLSLTQSTGFRTFAETGPRGTVGRGGSGGAAGFFEYRWEETDRFLGIEVGGSSGYERWRGVKGEDGPSGTNSVGIKQPAGTALKPFHLTLTSFKSFARGSFHNCVTNYAMESNVNEFLDDLEKNKLIRSLYDILGLVNDLKELEIQYHELQSKREFATFFEFLLSRIDEKAQNPANSLESQKVYSFLYTATLIKMCNIKNRVNQKTVVNLAQYLYDMKEDVGKMKEMKDQLVINNYRNEYQNSLDSKIHAANEFIENRILPQVDNIFEGLDDQIRTLVNEVVANQQATAAAIKKCKEQERELKKKSFLKGVLNVVKIGSAMLGAVAPAAAVASGIASIAESQILGDSSQGNVNVPTATAKFKISVANIGLEYHKKLEILKDQLTTVKNGLSGDNQSPVFREIEGKLNEVIAKVDLKRLSKNIRDIASLPDIFEKCKETLTSIKNKVKEKIENIFGTGYIDKVEHAWNAINVAKSTATAFFQKLRNDKAKIKAISDTIKKLENELWIWVQHEKNIYNVMLPKVEEMERTIDDANENAKGKSHVELDVSKWNVQSALRDMKLLFKKMSTSLQAEDDIERSVEKLIEGMTVLIDVYDRIDSYSDDAKLAMYIANIHSSQSNDITDIKLRDAINDLRENIQTNVVLNKFEMAMHAFKQHRFPFALFYLDQFQLPSYLQFNDTKTVSQQVELKISEMRSEIVDSRILIGRYQQHIYSDVPFNSNYSAPFYTWKNDKYKKEIAQLLRGEEVAIKADITKSSIDANKIALKFNQIGIRFKLSDPEVQNMFDGEFENFGVTMKMVGNSYYRCDDQFYCIPVDGNVVINYSIREKSDETPAIRNEVYEMIKHNDYFLSPYTMWSIKLTNISGAFNSLSRFAKEAIDLELVGQGQYLVRGQHTSDICTKQLQNFYRDIEH